ncbi:hypothetical protein CANARDRAFT_28136 [[Candida] arabinofermentans NRRL YB-2248]|uniref:Uncharacterized protein n=1 Tax=[Candida] arabinofermentans NRRL YB-2248 TaxID=983967 RepID=A0A1E4T2W8_9ASCO|nr:hypothetical protein CANARDRAFT_28136 [[Candida] arabinofermentans NRRL YB-2248]
MSPFNDYCLVCEKICPSDSVYCSESCKLMDQQHTTSPTLSACSSLQSHSYNQVQQQQSQQQQNIISPLLTPRYQSINSYKPSINSNLQLLKSPQFKDLSYESPMLSSSYFQNDLDSNRLDLNSSYHQENHELQPQKSNQCQKLKTNTNTTAQSVSDLLSTCASENYKKWLSIH